MFWIEKLREIILDRASDDEFVDMIISERIDEMLKTRKTIGAERHYEREGQALEQVRTKLQEYIDGAYSGFEEIEKEYFYKKGKEILTETDEKVFKDYEEGIEKDIEIAKALLHILS